MVKLGAHWWAVTLVAAACGGRSTRGVGDESVTGDPAQGGTNGAAAAASTGGTGGSTFVAGTGGTGTGGAGGSVIPIESPDACMPDGIRLGRGGNMSTDPIPAGACEVHNVFYCAGETYPIQGGECAGSCTCLGNGAWSCESVDVRTNEPCNLQFCDNGLDIYQVGGSWGEDDGCTYCYCTANGIFCSEVACQRERRCAQLKAEYQLALADQAMCTPTSSTPQCTKRFRSDLVCSGDVPLNETWELEALVKLYERDGCQPAPPNCPAHTIPTGTHTVCTPEGVCRDVQ